MLSTKLINVIKLSPHLRVLRKLPPMGNSYRRMLSENIGKNGPTIDSKHMPDIPSLVNDEKNDEHSRKPDVVDVNINDMMEEDEDFAGTIGVQEPPQVIKSTDLTGAPIAPVDVNAWTDELAAAEGTVDMENYIEPELEYPPIPENRDNYFQFKGISIKLPMRMLKPGTYRYRMGEEDKGMADDMHICKF